jgi:putative NADH-flavin reductase
MGAGIREEGRAVSTTVSSVLVVGATGSIGRLAVAEALRAGMEASAMVRGESRAASLPDGTRAVVGDLTRAATLAESIDGVSAVGAVREDHGGARDAELVDYGAVRNVLSVLTAPVRIALMTTIGVTKHTLVTTGSVGGSGSYEQAACPTRSSAPGGSTTTTPASAGS